MSHLVSKNKLIYRGLDVPNFAIIQDNEHSEGRVFIVLNAANIFYNVRLLNDVKVFVQVNNFLSRRPNETSFSKNILQNFPKKYLIIVICPKKINYISFF